MLRNAALDTVNWLTYAQSYSAQRYSPLSQVNKDNVDRLNVDWVFQFEQTADRAKMECSPIVVDGIMYITGAANHIYALDARTGRELWRALNAAEPGYVPPVIHEAGGRRQLIIWDVDSLNGLDPETGRVFWSEPFKTNMGHCISTPRKLGDLLFISSFFDGSMMMQLERERPAAGVLWRLKGTNERNGQGLHSLMSTPFLEDGHIYGVCSYGQLRCLRADTGERVWETLAATTHDGKPTRWATAFLVKNGNRFFLYNEKGELIIARLSPQGYDEVSRVQILEPTNSAGGRDLLWSHPAFANRRVYARNDKEIICMDLSANTTESGRGP